ncbi:holo-ACP synthase [Priestia aryabhattai]|uniref:holo-ACP synthase n=1 Tax=Priestia aryabhattai TaxID=412384 RepID=UPI001873EDF5|nr:holo-ACP synthase [Priestia aryabhattai]MBE5102246.1 holo-ACP synthase [Priestia aryabhattai]
MIYGIGIDSVEIHRIESIYDKRPETLINRVLTISERKQFNDIKQKQRKMEWLAGRFSAKEAMSKAIGSGIGKTFDFQDGEILNNHNEKPTFHLSEKTKSYLPSNIKIHVSITHTKTTASSMVTIDEN